MLQQTMFWATHTRKRPLSTARRNVTDSLCTSTTRLLETQPTSRNHLSYLQTCTEKVRKCPTYCRRYVNCVLSSLSLVTLSVSGILCCNFLLYVNCSHFRFIISVTFKKTPFVLSSHGFSALSHSHFVYRSHKQYVTKFARVRLDDVWRWFPSQKRGETWLERNRWPS